MALAWLLFTCFLYSQPHSSSPQATAEEIKQAWKKQALLHHPDRHPDRNVEAKDKFQAVQHAYEVLRDTVLRAEYDKELLHRLYLEVSLQFGHPMLQLFSSKCRIDFNKGLFVFHLAGISPSICRLNTDCFWSGTPFRTRIFP